MAQPFDVYGAKSPNGTWSGMLGSMLSNETDISGPYFVTEDRSLAMEFTVPLAFSQLTLLSGLVSSNRDPFLILGVFSVTSLWFTVCCLVMMYTYQGAIISTFTVDKLKPKISTIEELIQNTGIGISTFRDSYPMAFFSKLVNTKYESLGFRIKQNLVAPSSKDTWVDAVEEGKVVFITETFYMKYLVGERFLKTGKCGIIATDVVFVPCCCFQKATKKFECL
ncbi:hypothetical protein CDAR_37001 [Caerostris darwini]|uniref:Ionotropic glutamate receptor C-terminal domain-containing protein n=1 Tax=Caerostris darwini TaxID=1538125 RepID=A0AAV4SJE5_9ARAC|nr:hypothetical protein CDAR_37001 [Caerostris darwini]